MPSVRRHQALVRLTEKVKQRRSTENIPHAVVFLGLDLDTISICLQCGEKKPPVVQCCSNSLFFGIAWLPDYHEPMQL
jgi:hypothetical protein